MICESIEVVRRHMVITDIVVLVVLVVSDRNR
jgi:hypothetical protein